MYRVQRGDHVWPVVVRHQDPSAVEAVRGLAAEEVLERQHALEASGQVDRRRGEGAEVPGAGVVVELRLAAVVERVGRARRADGRDVPQRGPALPVRAVDDPAGSAGLEGLAIEDRLVARVGRHHVREHAGVAGLVERLHREVVARPGLESFDREHLRGARGRRSRHGRNARGGIEAGLADGDRGVAHLIEAGLAGKAVAARRRPRQGDTPRACRRRHQIGDASRRHRVGAQRIRDVETTAGDGEAGHRGHRLRRRHQPELELASGERGEV